MASLPSLELFMFELPAKSPSELLSHAVVARDLDRVRELIPQCRDLNFAKVGNPPLMLAAEAEDDGILEALLVGGVAPHAAATRTGWNVLHELVSRNNRELMKKVLPYVDYSGWGMQDNNGKTPWHAAVDTRATRTLSLLATQDLAQPYVDRADEKGVTPLMQAVQQEWVEGVELLLKAGANPIIVDKAGVSAVDRAVKQEWENAPSALFAAPTPIAAPIATSVVSSTDEDLDPLAPAPVGAPAESGVSSGVEGLSTIVRRRRPG